MIGKLCSSKPCVKKSSARVVDGKLILSLPEALKPIVWQMDLGQAKASALEVSENQDHTGYRLLLKTPRGESLDVASFPTRDLALEGLMAASCALENAQGHIWAGGSAAQTPANDGLSHPHISLRSQVAQNSSQGRWVGLFLALALIIVLGFIWNSPSTSLTEIAENTDLSTPALSDPANNNGVPLSADSFLNEQP